MPNGTQPRDKRVEPAAKLAPGLARFETATGNERTMVIGGKGGQCWPDDSGDERVRESVRDISL